MKSADIKIGETYSWRQSPRGSWGKPRPAKVLAVGRYDRWSQQESPRGQIRVVIEYDHEYADKKMKAVVPPGQIEGLWSELGPKYAEQDRRAAEYRAQKQADEDARRARWTKVEERLLQLNINQTIDEWSRKEPAVRMKLETMERLLDMSEGI